MSIHPQHREVKDVPKQEWRQTWERKGLVQIEMKPWRARDFIPWALNQDDPFHLCLRGVRELGYKLQPTPIGRHGQEAPSPNLESVNKSYLHQKNVQLVERVQHIARAILSVNFPASESLTPRRDNPGKGKNNPL